MPDVGVLNLQIHDNADKAAQGLESLVGVLNRVKGAVNFGTQLGTISNNLAKLTTVINDSIQGSTVSKLTEIATALEKMKNIGKVDIRISYGKEDEYAAIARAFEQTEAYSHGIIADTKKAAESAVDMSDGFNTAEESLAEVKMQSAGVREEIENLKDEYGRIDLNKYFDPSKLPIQALGMQANEASKEIAQYGAMVKDAREILNGMAGGNLNGGLTGGGAAEEIKTTAEETIGYTEQIAEGMAEVGASTKEVSFAPMNEQLQQVTESLDEALRKKRELNEQEDFEIKSRNYPALREAALDDGGNVARNMLLGYGLTQEAIEKCETYAEALKMTMGEVNQAVDEFADKTNQPAGSMLQESAEAAAEVAAAQPEVAPVDTSGLSTAIELQEQLAEATPNVEQFERTERSARDTSDRLRYSLTGLDKEVKNKEMDFGNASRAAGLFRVSLADIRRDAGRLISPLANLGTQFANIARRMAIRAIIRQFTSALQEGVENVYHYSDAIGGSFASSMDSASTALAQMRNSVGAALAPAIEALIPILNTVVSWFITAINYVNQFFALLRGQATWIRALEVSTKAYDKSTKQAQKTAKAAKELLADWDELNIIQSEGGNGGTGGAFKVPTDYSKMFEEVGEYAQWVKDLVGAIKDQFGDVLTLVKKIGVALLGWALASNFTGLLGTLGTLLAAGALIDLQFNISAMLNKKYLETGEEGWLVASVLTALVGGVLMRGVLGKVLGGQYAYLGIPIMLTVDALARTVVTLGESDVSALSKEALISNITSALEIGGVAGYLSHRIGHFTAGRAAGVGAGAVLITFGVLTALKASVEAVQNEKITEETIKGQALGSISMGIGSGIAAKMFVPGMSLARSFGFGAATGAGAFLFTLGATVGITATTEAAKSGITKDVIKKDVEASLLMGTGIGIASGVLFSLGAGGALAVGGLAALASFGALVAVQALVSLPDEERIKWGENQLTQEEIENFVNENLFTVNVPATIQLVKGTLKNVDKETWEGIEQEAAAMIGDLQVIKLGLATEDTYDSLRKDLFGEDGSGGVIGKLKSYAEGQKTLIKTSFSLIPMTNESGDPSKELTKQYAEMGLKGWKDVEDEMNRIGNQLAEALKGGTQEGLKGYDDETILTLTEQLNNIKNALKMSEISGGALSNMFKGIEGMDKKSVDGILTTYEQYKAELTDAFREMEEELRLSYLRLASYYEQMGDSDKASEYRSMAKSITDSMDKRVADQVNRIAEGEGMPAIREALLNLFRGSGSFEEDMIDIVSEKISPIAWEDLLSRALFENGGQVDDSLKKQMIGLFEGLVKDAYSIEDAEEVLKAIKTGFVSWADVIPETVINALLDSMGVEGEKRNLFAEMFKSVLGGDHPDAGEAAKEAEEAAKEATKDFSERVEAAVGDNSIEQDTTIIEDVTYEPGEVFGESLAVQEMEAVEEKVADLNNGATLTLNDLKFDTSGAEKAANSAALSIENMASRIREAFRSIDGIGFTFTAGDESIMARLHAIIPVIPAAAGGGIFKSGDVFSANENGRTELIGSYGNKTAVVNNDQVVGAVTNGVAQANSGMESRLGTIETLLQRILQKEFTAKAVPSSGWGAHAARSADAYSKVTG